MKTNLNYEENTVFNETKNLIKFNRETPDGFLTIRPILDNYLEGLNTEGRRRLPVKSINPKTSLLSIERKFYTVNARIDPCQTPSPLETREREPTVVTTVRDNGRTESTLPPKGWTLVHRQGPPILGHSSSWNVTVLVSTPRRKRYEPSKFVTPQQTERESVFSGLVSPNRGHPQILTRRHQNVQSLTINHQSKTTGQRIVSLRGSKL